MRYRVSDDAAQDLDEIFLYWAKRIDSATAERVIGKILERFPFLADYPDAGRAADDIAPGLRCFPTGKYLIYYRGARNGMVILRIIHSARDQLAAFMKNKPE